MTEEEKTAAFMAREEELFREHVKEVFGERHLEFGPGPVALLRALWRRGRDAPRKGADAAQMNKTLRTPRVKGKRGGVRSAGICRECSGVGWTGRDAVRCLACGGTGLDASGGG